MTIEQDIKQATFKTNLEKAVVNVLYTYNWLRDHSQDIYKPFGLKIQHYNILRILKGKYPAATSPGEIKEVMLDKSPDLTRLLDKLVEMNLVDRELCPENRRKMDVRITNQGIELLNVLMKRQENLYADLAERVSEDEANMLSNLLDKIRS
jgi:DNA-binding MarR family transcriptional regulator